MANNKNDEPKKYVNYDEEDSDSFIKEVNSSLAQQIDSDFDDEHNDDGEYHKGKKRPGKKKRMSRLIKVPLSVLAVLIVLCGLALFTSPGRKVLINIAGRYVYSHLDYQVSDEAQPVMNEDTDSAKADSHIINILLIGIEEIAGDQNTDSMIIASMNTENHTLKLTSLMRDLYVETPGHDKGRLNAVYAKGGIELLYEAIKVNFGITINGYCMVNFKAFEQIVDAVGGVNIKLTKKEADYLNSTNYISKKANRNVVPGTQLMNGNQALGYCRVRKVPTSTESSDFGRTQRQRVVLQAIYSKLRSKNLVKQFLIVDEILKKVEIRTDITKDEFISYMEAAADLKIKELETLRIPSDGNYKNKTVRLGGHNAAVLVPKDWDATREEIYDFIHGDSPDKEKQD